VVRVACLRGFSYSKVYALYYAQSCGTPFKAVPQFHNVADLKPQFSPSKSSTREDSSTLLSLRKVHVIGYMFSFSLACELARSVPLLTSFLPK